MAQGGETKELEEAGPGRIEAAAHLFEYIYLLRFRRKPFPWEWVVGWALITGAVVVVRPVEAQPLAAVHSAAHAVKQTLGLLEQAS